MKKSNSKTRNIIVVTLVALIMMVILVVHHNPLTDPHEENVKNHSLCCYRGSNAGILSFL